MADDWRKLVELAIEDRLAEFPFAEIPKRLALFRCGKCGHRTMFDSERTSVRCFGCGRWWSTIELRSLRSQPLRDVTGEERAQFERDVVAKALQDRAAELLRGAEVRLADRAAAGLYEQVKGSNDDE